MGLLVGFRSRCSLEGLMLKLKLQYFGHLMQRVDSLEKTLMLGGTGGRREGDDRGWDGWMASPTRWTWVWVNSGSWWWTGRPSVLQFMGSQRVGHDWATELTDGLLQLPEGSGPDDPITYVEILGPRLWTPLYGAWISTGKWWREDPSTGPE